MCVDFYRNSKQYDFVTLCNAMNSNSTPLNLRQKRKLTEDSNQAKTQYKPKNLKLVKVKIVVANLPRFSFDSAHLPW